MAAVNVDPPGSEIPAAGGKSSHKISNGCPSRLAFKVKSSNNNQIRIKPVFGFIEPGGAADLEITRLNGAPKEDKLIIQFKEAAPDAADASAIFKDGPAMGEIIVPVSAK
ncbi:MSP domain and PapD-like domain-containing protein [Strongyloides ratti]|uniref:MSP domain and PapD-like domain-containing protein n=1 Tax=Strongyloides ratti TaxID=34506 RepID=A0A090LCA3_STRRB|nr:MSP domain and PapD-like domain-containing protein [Strongyloides ratti]CEF65718.1 MSP domain and PapD-like domain-containing protein [Strongyloides ratti]